MISSRSLVSSCVRLSGLSLVALVALACRDFNEIRWTVRRATIEQPPPVGSRVDVPQTIVAGQAAIVTVHTFGEDDCVRGAGTNSTVSGATAVIEPFDSVIVQMPSNMACLSLPADIRHSVSLVFSKAGPATIRIVGWSDVQQAEVTVERAIAVQ